MLVDIEKGEAKFRMKDEEVTFNIHRIMKQLTDIRVASVIKCVDDHGIYFFGYRDKD